jgi:uncharacterized protein (DUF1800 family)
MLTQKTITGCGALIVASAIVFEVCATLVHADEPQAELEAAQNAYQSYYKEWDSLAMARAATREVAVSARRTAESDLNQLLAARETVRQTIEALLETARKIAQAQPGDQKKTLEETLTKQSAELIEAEKLLAQKRDTVRRSADRLIIDQRTTNERHEGFLQSEEKLGGLLAAIWSANGKILNLKAEQAERAAQDKASAGPDEAAKAAAAAAAARREARENDLLSAWEKQLWLRVMMTYPETTSVESARADSADAARIAERLAETETEPALKQAYVEFAASQRQFEALNQGRLTELAKQAEQVGRDLDALRAAAMGGLEPLPEDQWDYAKARHLLVRAGFGGTPQEVDRLCQMGLHAAVDYLVDFARQPAANVALEASPASPSDALAAKLRHGWTRDTASRQPDALDAGRLRRIWFARMVESPRPLQEKLTLFWHGHFATQQSVVVNNYSVHRQNELYREHAAGNFGALLYGIVHDPAMIRYLDNNSNVKGHANENLAREIMELFSMGAYQGYDEKDVREAARALTGYTFDNRSGQFRFLQANHDPEEKTIFGNKGAWSGDDLARLILEQPATSRFIAGKLFEFFAYQEPGAETVEKLAAVLRYQNYELAPTLKNLFTSKEFYSERAMNAQIKCPVQLVVGALRDLGVRQISDYSILDRMTQQMGQQLFEPPDVKGWRYGRTWISSDRLFMRYNAVAELVRSVPQPGRQGMDLVSFVQQGGCQNAAQIVDYLAKTCLLVPLSDQKRDELIGYMGELPPAGEWAQRHQEFNERLQNLLILITSLPEYQMT